MPGPRCSPARSPPPPPDRANWRADDAAPPGRRSRGKEPMDDTEFDRALIAAAFELIAQNGWGRLRMAEAARAAALPLDRARLRFPGRGVLLIRFGRMADQAALAEAACEGATREPPCGRLVGRSG